MIKNEIAAMFGIAELIIIMFIGAFLIATIIGVALLIRFLLKKNTPFKKQDFK